MKKCEVLKGLTQAINESANPLNTISTEDLQAQLDDLNKQFEAKFGHPVGDVEHRDLSDPMAVRINAIKDELASRSAAAE